MLLTDLLLGFLELRLKQTKLLELNLDLLRSLFVLGVVVDHVVWLMEWSLKWQVSAQILVARCMRLTLYVYVGMLTSQWCVCEEQL